MHPYSTSIKTLKSIVEEKTKGALKIDIYWAQSLVPVKEEFDACASGVCDISTCVTPYFVGKVPIIDTSAVPFYANFDTWPKADMEARPYWEKAFAKQNLKHLCIPIIAVYDLYMHKGWAKTPADLKGKLLRSPGGGLERCQVLWGATPVTLTVAEEYEAIKRGTTDGTTCSIPTFFRLKLYEVAKYVTHLELPIASVSIVMNLDTWNSLPKEWQKIIEDALPEVDRATVEATRKDIEAAMGRYKEVGMSIYIPTEEERAKWITPVMPIWDEYAKKLGPDGEAVLKIFRKWSLEYKK